MGSGWDWESGVPSGHFKHEAPIGNLRGNVKSAVGDVSLEFTGDARLAVQTWESPAFGCSLSLGGYALTHTGVQVEGRGVQD